MTSTQRKKLIRVLGVLVFVAVALFGALIGYVIHGLI